MYLLANKIGFGDSLLVLFIGMSVIFLVLAILVVTVIAYVKALNAVQNKDKVKAPAPVAVAPAPEPVAVASDDEIVAAITAAIAIIYASESETGEVPPFRVKSILLRK